MGARIDALLKHNERMQIRVAELRAELDALRVEREALFQNWINTGFSPAIDARNRSVLVSNKIEQTEHMIFAANRIISENMRFIEILRTYDPERPELYDLD